MTILMVYSKGTVSLVIHHNNENQTILLDLSNTIQNLIIFAFSLKHNRKSDELNSKYVSMCR